MTVDEVAAITPDELKSLPEMKQKVIENLIRRVARRRGMELQRSRTRDPQGVDKGLYRLTDFRTRAVVAGGDAWGCAWDLHQVAQYLAEQVTR
jgi:hypothetical protein